MSSSLTRRPTPILSKGYSRLRDVRRNNIKVAVWLSESLKTMLGPKGMNKMIVDVVGKPFITNDGREALDQMDATNPVAKLIIDIARSQDFVAGDGTKTSVILAGELLKKAEKLLNLKVHPTNIIKGYDLAAKHALNILETLSTGVSIEDEATLKKIAKTVIGGRLVEDDKVHLANLVVEAVKIIAEEKAGKIIVDPIHLDIKKQEGKSVQDSELVYGLILAKPKPHLKMPSKIEGAKIALVKLPLDPHAHRAVETRKIIMLNRPEDLKGLSDMALDHARGIVNQVKHAGANVLLCRKTMSDLILGCFAEENILALNLVSEADMLRLEKATGAKIVESMNDLNKVDIGQAKLVEYRLSSFNELLFIDRCKDPRAVTILVRGGTVLIVAEMERIVKDCIKAISVAIEAGKAVPGGGATEFELARKLRDYSKTYTGREQLAIEAYADALEAIPRTLASNAGLDPIDVLVELKSGHADGNINLGVNGLNRKVEDMVKRGCLDAFTVKQHALKVSGEVARMILKIDDAIAATNLHVIKVEKKRKEDEIAFKTNERVIEASKRREEFKELEKFDKELDYRQQHPEVL